VFSALKTGESKNPSTVIFERLLLPLGLQFGSLSLVTAIVYVFLAPLSAITVTITFVATPAIRFGLFMLTLYFESSAVALMSNFETENGTFAL
jgi:hypothetical protein